MTESQKQFEEWALNAVDCFALPFFIMKDESGKYFESATELAWQAWQASRAALVVELPDSVWSNLQDDEVMTSESVKRALYAAGVAYK